MLIFLASLYIGIFILLIMILPLWAFTLSYLDGLGVFIGACFTILFLPILLPFALVLYIIEKLYPTPKEEDVRKKSQEDFDNSEIGKHFRRIRENI